MIAKLRTVGACVWVQSQSRDRVDVEARLATGTVTLALAAADARKADERALSGEATRNQLRRRGKVIPDLPEIEGIAAACRRAAAQSKGDPAVRAGVYNYEKLSLPVGGAVYLHTFTGCLRPHEITRYEAGYVK